MSDQADLTALARGIAAGDKPAVARALNLIENRRDDAQQAIEELLSIVARQRQEGARQRIGLTGPPGVGKSTLTAAVAREMRGRGLTVGVVAVDPSSVRSGGALLGDRARMSFDPGDQGLFVRSLSTAGDAGGLSYAAHAAADVLAAAYDVVLVETTGVGQTETDVEHVVDTVCLVIQPGSGDVLQFIKAGIMEIPDVLVVNKADHGRLAKRAASDLTGALDALRGVGVGEQTSWQVPVCLTSARDRTGVTELVDVLAEHRAAFSQHTLLARRQRGAVAWAMSLFRRRHGEFGVKHMGGQEALMSRFAVGVRDGKTALRLATSEGEAFLARLRAGS